VSISHPSNEVRELLDTRLRTGCRDDGATIALVLEGGGMRGILSATTAAVLDEAGLLEQVDLFVGTSAGSVNAAAAVGGAIREFAPAYASVYASPEFVDPRRALRRQAVVASRHIVDEAERRFSVFSRAMSAQARTRLAVVATDVATGRPEALTHFADKDDLAASVNGSALIPLIGGAPVVHRDRRWLDGGITEAVPLPSAAALGATHALVVGTRPRGTTPSTSPADRAILAYLRRLNPLLAQAYDERPVRYRELMTSAFDGHWRDVTTLVIAPGAHDPVPSRLERNPSTLTVAMLGARERARRQILSRSQAIA